MGIIPGRAKTASVTLLLVGLTFGLIAGLTYSSVGGIILTELPTPTAKAAAILGLATISVLSIRNAIQTEYRGMWVIGVLLMQGAYGILGATVVDILAPADIPRAIGITAGVTLGLLSLLMLYGFTSNRSFLLWEVYAVLFGVSAAILGLAATRIDAIGVAAATVALLGFLMYVVHVIARFKKGVPKPLRNGARLYVAITGVPVELGLFLAAAVLKRIF